MCAETIYERRLPGPGRPGLAAELLRTARTYRHRRGRGRSRDGALKQCTEMKPIRQRPARGQVARQAGHWEGDLIIGAGQRSAIATLVERKTRLTILVRAAGRARSRPAVGGRADRRLHRAASQGCGEH